MPAGAALPLLARSAPLWQLSLHTKSLAAGALPARGCGFRYGAAGLSQNQRSHDICMIFTHKQAPS